MQPSQSRFNHDAHLPAYVLKRMIERNNITVAEVRDTLENGELIRRRVISGQDGAETDRFMWVERMIRSRVRRPS
jgi:hypothetical protein